MEKYWFKSTLFKIEPGEDDETNPHRYGKSFAYWLKEKLTDLGYATEVIPEDWGWCVICSRDPFLLWVGCANVDETSEHNEKDTIPRGRDVVWHCFIEVEVGFFKGLTKKIDTTPSIAKLNSELSKILNNTDGIKITEEPKINTQGSS